MSYVLTDYQNPAVMRWNRTEEIRQAVVTMMDDIEKGETTIHDLYEELERCGESLQELLELFEETFPPNELEETHQGYIDQLSDLLREVENLASETHSAVDDGPEEDESEDEFCDRILSEARSFFEDLYFDLDPPEE